MAKIYGNTVGASTCPKSYVLQTEDGAELVGVLVDDVTVFDATTNDVRINKIFAGEDGLQVGEKIIPSYHTRAGYKKINSGKEFKVSFYDPLDLYDFTELQIIICQYSDSIDSSVKAEKVVIGETVYNVNSMEPVATVIKDLENKTINLGIINESEEACVLRYFTYKEIY